jgi:putative hydrolase of HD superfamily
VIALTATLEEEYRGFLQMLINRKGQMDKRQCEVDANRILECFAELSILSELPRIGWVMAGVTNPESVSDHCYETALFAYVLAKHIDHKFNLEKVLTMALFHELGEARITDLPRRSARYLRAAKHPAEEAAARDILGGLADELAPLQEEFHARQTPEARLVEAAEELQIIFRALLYAKQNRGDLSEYRNDVAKYDSQGFDLAADLAKIIGNKLDHYLAGREYWEIGYRKQSDA